MKRRVLIAWIGRTDLRAANDQLSDGELGPIGQAVKVGDYDRVALLSNYPAPETAAFVPWLENLTAAEIRKTAVPLDSPTDFGEIYEAAAGVLEELVDDDPDAAMTFHLSPGTPAMAAIWMILAETRFPAELIESSREAGVRTVSLPFEISADYVPTTAKQAEKDILALTQGLPDRSAKFDSILHRSQKMKDLLARAQRIAVFDVPILILGESGTGKELLAQAIHAASPRTDDPMISVNCGAIPKELVESEFFGHKKGAFTGADNDHQGFLERANQGTLFLDEIGEMPPDTQVKLLRALQEAKIRRVGETDERAVDIRVIAATNRDLAQQVAAGEFRADLFHRLAVGVLRIPPLRERGPDLGMLINHALEQANQQCRHLPEWKDKKISAGARNLLKSHGWPGNVRELFNTVARTVIWSLGPAVTADDVESALLELPRRPDDHILNRELNVDFDLEAVIAEVAVHYLKRAMDETNGKKTDAAALVGFSNYQRLTDWLKKYGLE